MMRGPAQKSPDRQRREIIAMLYPRRGVAGSPARSDRELAVGAAILFLISALLALLGSFQAAFAAFAAAMACVSLRTWNPPLPGPRR